MVAGSFYSTWCYNDNHRSTLAVILLHTVANLALKEAISMPAGILIVVILYLLQAGLEELGWRGYMLDRLQAIWKPLTASLVLGVAHAFWHLPLFWIVGTNQSRYISGIDFTLFIAFVRCRFVLQHLVLQRQPSKYVGSNPVSYDHKSGIGHLPAPGTGEYIFKSITALGAVVIAIAWSLPTRRQKQVMST